MCSANKDACLKGNVLVLSLSDTAVSSNSRCMAGVLTEFPESAHIMSPNLLKGGAKGACDPHYEVVVKCCSWTAWPFSNGVPAHTHYSGAQVMAYGSWSAPEQALLFSSHTTAFGFRELNTESPTIRATPFLRKTLCFSHYFTPFAVSDE